MLHGNKNIIKHKIGLLNLAEELGNVFSASVALVSSFRVQLTYSLTHCPIFGVHRQIGDPRQRRGFA